MAETNFPLAPTFADSMLAPPPVLEEGLSTEEHLQKIKKYLDGQYVSLNKMQNSIASGWLVSTLRVLNLTADTIVADSVFTQDLWIGKDDSTNGYIGLLGTATQIKIVDENGTTRFLAGDLGAGVTNWGVQMMDTAGTVIFEAGDQVFIDGAVITDATIVNAKIVNSTIDGSTKLANSSVPNSKISSMSADKITVAGTLTCSSTATAIDVTSGGVVTLRNGADLVFKASASGNTNYIIFQNSAGTDQGYIFYTVSGDTFGFSSAGGPVDIAANNGQLNLTGGTNVVITAVGTGGDVSITADDVVTITSSTSTITMTSNITLNPDAAGVIIMGDDTRPGTNNAYSLGSSSFKWSDMWTVVDHVGDIAFDNGWRITEPDKVYKYPRWNGLLIMSPTWQVMGGFDEMGNLCVSGSIIPFYDFPSPDIPRREPK